MSATPPPCPICGWSTHITRAIGLFSGQPFRYRADYPDAPDRTSRERAAEDMCAWQRRADR